MGKLAKWADPLRARASRVEKSRVQRDGRILPSWYFRVRAVRFNEDRERNSYDFDEDLSELEEDKEQRDDAEQFKEEEGEEDCECGGKDPERDCQFEDDDDMDDDDMDDDDMDDDDMDDDDMDDDDMDDDDMDDDDMDDDESERSYDGSDADYYYELKEEREERKREKLQEQKEKDREREFERTKEEEVRAAYRSLREAEKENRTIPVESLAGQGFKLFCSDHVDHFYSDLYATKRVDFYHLDGTDDGTDNPRLNKQKPGGETDMLYGDVYLDANASCNFGPFCAPNRVSRKVVKVKSCDGKYELSFKFIGNGYLKLRVSREMVFMKPYSANAPAPPPTAPEVFEFVGILRDREKEKAERQERMAKIRRSPSPRESWFEMNHPMGAWNQPW